jgi:hypothetical protein
MIVRFEDWPLSQGSEHMVRPNLCYAGSGKLAPTLIAPCSIDVQ